MLVSNIWPGAQGNRQARSAHETLVEKVVETMLRDGRMVWKNLSLRARVLAG